MERQEPIPRGLRRGPSARYVGVSPTTFDDWVDAGKMPRSFKVKGVVLWDRLELDDAFDALKDGASCNEWDDDVAA